MEGAHLVLGHRLFLLLGSFYQVPNALLKYSS